MLFHQGLEYGWSDVRLIHQQKDARADGIESVRSLRQVLQASPDGASLAPPPILAVDDFNLETGNCGPNFVGVRSRHENYRLHP